MHWVVLNVAYPFAPVGPDAVGGAGQIVTQLDIALVRAGHDSIVMACEGSVTEGILLATERPSGVLDEAERHRVYDQYRFTLRKFLEKWPIDLIHMHGLDFYEYLPPAGIPVLVTLHWPGDSYPEKVFHLERPQTFLQFASASQRSACPDCNNLLPDLEGPSVPELAKDVSRTTTRARFRPPPIIDRYLAVYERLVNEARAVEQPASEPAAISAPGG